MVIGWVLIVFGFFTAVAGAALLALFGSGSVLSTSVQTLSTTTPALVGDLGTIQNASDIRVWSGTPVVVVNSDNTGAKPTFIGIGRTEDVDGYLSGVARDDISDFSLSPFNMTVNRRDGAEQAGPPGDQSFWVAELESGSSTQLSWEIADGRYSIVVMNADGSAGVDAPMSVGISIPNSTGLWILVICVGAALLIGGGVLVFFGAKREPAPAWNAQGQYPPPM